jgi:hypothetical protein
MSDQEGILHMQPSGRWAVVRPRREPVEITSGELFRVEVGGKMRLTKMAQAPGRGYYSVDGFDLRDGMRAAIGPSRAAHERDREERARDRTKRPLVSETGVPTAKHLIELIARGERTREQIIEACKLWLKLQAGK